LSTSIGGVSLAEDLAGHVGLPTFERKKLSGMAGRNHSRRRKIIARAAKDRRKRNGQLSCAPPKNAPPDVEWAAR